MVGEAESSPFDRCGSWRNRPDREKCRWDEIATAQLLLLLAYQLKMCPLFPKE